MHHKTFKEQQDAMRVTGADWFVTIVTICAFALIFWSAIESLSIADNPREALSARDQPRNIVSTRYDETRADDNGLWVKVNCYESEVHKTSDDGLTSWVDVEQVCD